MNTKILFTDLDGTLLNDEKEIPAENKAAIHKALSLGHNICIATGRSLYSATAVIDQLELTRPGCYAITYNGAQIYDCHTMERIFSAGVPLSLIRPVFALAYEYGLHCQTYKGNEVLCEKDTEAVALYRSRTRMPYRLVTDVMEHLTDMPPKILAIESFEPEKLHAFRNALDARFSHQLDSFFSSSDYLEIVPKGIHKGSAITFLADYLHIPMEHTVSAGDEENDITMLKTTAVGAVMANARAEIKAHGTYITKKNNNEGGLAEIVERFLLGEY